MTAAYNYDASCAGLGPSRSNALDGVVHRAYSARPNSVYIVNSAGAVAFRALWAGQRGLLRRTIDLLLRLETVHRTSVTARPSSTPPSSVAAGNRWTTSGARWAP